MKNHCVGIGAGTQEFYVGQKNGDGRVKEMHIPVTIRRTIIENTSCPGPDGNTSNSHLADVTGAGFRTWLDRNPEQSKTITCKAACQEIPDMKRTPTRLQFASAQNQKQRTILETDPSKRGRRRCPALRVRSTTGLRHPGLRVWMGREPGAPPLLIVFLIPIKMLMPDSPQWLKQPVSRNNAAAVLSVVAALVFSLLLETRYGYEPFTPFLCAILFSAWLGGVMPGSIAIVLSLVAFHIFFLIPLYPDFSSFVERELPRLLIASLASGFVVALAASQRSAAEALRESEQRYLSLFQNMAEGVAYLRILFEEGKPQDAIYLRVNPSWEKLTGLKNVVGRKTSEVTLGDSEAKREFFERSARVVSTGQPDRCEIYSIPLKKWLSVSLYCPRYEHVAVVIDDITERKQAEQTALEAAQETQEISKQKENFMRLVIDTIPIMAWSIRPDGVVDFLNKRWLDFSGLTLEQYVGDPMQVLHPEEKSRIMKRWEAEMTAGQAYEDEMRLRRADGQYRRFLVRTVPLRDENGQIVKWYGTSPDIEDRRRANEALRQSEYDLAQAQRVARIGNWNFDIASDSVRWSEELYRIFDVDKSTFGGAYESFLSRVHPDDRSLVLQTTAEARASGNPFDFVYRISTRNGQVKHIRETGYAMKDDEGLVSALFGTAQDITEQKNAENALRASGARLQALSRRLVELQEFDRKELARELHDRVGQNLTALGINLGILGSTVPQDASEALRERLADSETLVESTVAAIRDVVSELRPPMLDDMGLVLALKWYAKQVTARTGVPIDVRSLAPAERLKPEAEIALFRIAQEALNNVTKHARASRVEISLGQTGSEYVMSVKDDGVGYDTSEPREPRHSGLGMVTMLERSQAVGGRFEVQTVAGRGTQLTVRVPA